MTVLTWKVQYLIFRYIETLIFDISIYREIDLAISIYRKNRYLIFRYIESLTVNNSIYGYFRYVRYPSLSTVV